MRYKAVIFDFDDTLVKTREAKWAQHKQVAKQFYDIDLADETLAAHWGKPYDEVFAPILAGLAARGITDGIVYIGDALTDWQAASAAGLDLIGVTRGLTDEATFANAGATKIVSSINQIFPYL